MSSIELRNVSVSFDIFKTKKSATFWEKMLGRGVVKSNFFALRDVNIKLDEGDRVGLIGKNGSGKSTLLKVMAGLLPPSLGNIEVDGQIFPALTAAPGVLKKATCAQNIILQGLAYGMKGTELKKYVEGASDFSNLGDFLNSTYKNLSAGMKGRFAVSTLHGTNPDLLFMDEWIGTADKKVLEKNNGLLKNLIENSEIFVIASHRKSLIQDHCNRVLVLENGKIIFDGDVEDAFDYADL